jgi:Tfp pilus assembly protein PilO
VDKMKQYVVLTVLGAIVLTAAGWFLLLSPKRTEAADLRTQADQQIAANGALRTQVSVLKAQAKALPAKQAQLAAVAAKIPENPALPALVRALQKAAEESDVELVSVAPTAPTDVTAGPAAAPVGSAPTNATAVTTTVTGTPAVNGATAATGALKQISLALNVVGGYFQVEQFLDKVESLSRAMKVKTMALAPGTNPVVPGSAAGAEGSPDKTLSATISAMVYMAPGRTTLAPATAPAVGK